MLDENGVDYTYREYVREPLTAEEIAGVIAKIGTSPRAVLRSRDATKAGLTGDETDEELIALMASNPKLLQRPIGVVGDRAAVGRPPEALLALISA